MKKIILTLLVTGVAVAQYGINVSDGYRGQALYVGQNSAGTVGGYFQLPNINYGPPCVDQWGNVVNVPAPVSGMPKFDRSSTISGIGSAAYDALLWVSAGPGPSVPRGCANQMPLLQQITGININVYLLSQIGLATTNTAYNSLDALQGGAHLGMSLTADEGVFFRNVPVDSGHPTWCVYAGNWSPGTAYTLGTIIIDTVGQLQKVTTAGTTSNTPAFPAWNNNGGTTTDGTVVWTNQGIAITAGCITPPGSTGYGGGVYGGMLSAGGSAWWFFNSTANSWNRFDYLNPSFNKVVTTTVTGNSFQNALSSPSAYITPDGGIGSAYLTLTGNPANVDSSGYLISLQTGQSPYYAGTQMDTGGNITASCPSGVTIDCGIVSAYQFRGTTGFYTAATNYDAIQAKNGGVVALNVYATGALAADSQIDLKVNASEPATPGTAGYGGLSYKGGNVFWYYNSTSSAWAMVDFSAGGGSSNWTLSGSLLYPNSTGDKVLVGRTSDDSSGAILQVLGGVNVNGVIQGIVQSANTNAVFQGKNLSNVQTFAVTGNGTVGTSDAVVFFSSSLANPSGASGGLSALSGSYYYWNTSSSSWLNWSPAGPSYTYSLTGYRALNVTYTNSASHAITVYVTCSINSSATCTAYSGGVETGVVATTAAASTFAMMTWMVPAGATYEVLTSGSPSLIQWSETN